MNFGREEHAGIDPSRTIGNRSSCSRCEEMERRLSDIRKANGGHMFAGARAGS